jgi:RimK family alpha-L-glutamate ligase
MFLQVHAIWDARSFAPAADVGARVAIVGTRTETNLDIADAWQALGIDAEVVTPSLCLELLRSGDVALGRVDVRRSLDGVESGLLVLAALRRRGVHLLNTPAALIRAHDKLRTARALAAASVPHPETGHVTLARPVSPVAPPVVVKPRFGSWGADVIRCETDAELREAVAALAERPWFRRHGALVQALVPPLGHDLRVLVAGGTIVGAESRIAAPDEWRTNISLGGSACAALVPPRARRLAVAAAHAVGGDFVGIDLLPDGDGYVVIEVNGAVDFEVRYSLPGRDVFADIAEGLGLVRPEARVLAASRAG